ncbi:unnamed protein product [Mytilus coruscus]|uniref:L-asparaginase N-terminal domain-containing protein n=1 Tax=Mytilus coruscus TaxID=42192 RepID=A0A6J8BLE4_MYTCO|nr:unnamed protein product [Mytilus coruscus]
MKLFPLNSTGTIDTVLENSKRGIEVSEEAAIVKILDRGRVSTRPTIVKACSKNSQELTHEDLNKIATLCKNSVSSKILITHGTDTMVETAKFLADHNFDKTILLTGAFRPETFKDTDADFNVGFALGVLHCLATRDVYIAMNGGLFHWSNVSHDVGQNYFV